MSPALNGLKPEMLARMPSKVLNMPAPSSTTPMPSNKVETETKNTIQMWLEFALAILIVGRSTAFDDAALDDSIADYNGAIRMVQMDALDVLPEQCRGASPAIGAIDAVFETVTAP